MTKKKIGIIAGIAAALLILACVAVWFFFIPFGWKLITYLQSFLPLTIFGTLWFWIFWALAKGAISIFIGIPAFLYQLVKTFFVQRKIQAASRSCRQDAEGI